MNDLTSPTETRPTLVPLSLHAIYEILMDLSYGDSRPDLMLVGMRVQLFFMDSMRREDYDSRRFNGAHWKPEPELPPCAVAIFTTERLNDPRYNRVQEFEAPAK